MRTIGDSQESGPYPGRVPHTPSVTVGQLRRLLQDWWALAWTPSDEVWFAAAETAGWQTSIFSAVTHRHLPARPLADQKQTRSGQKVDHFARIIPVWGSGSGLRRHGT
jgi:hypothetical protein